jgi:hypothetical protein
MEIATQADSESDLLRRETAQLQEFQLLAP